MNKKTQNQKLADIAKSFNDSQASSPSKPIGRPRTGKSSNPDFVAATVYILRKTQKDLIIHLRATDDTRDFSDITQIALAEWLDRQKATLSTD